MSIFKFYSEQTQIFLTSSLPNNIHSFFMEPSIWRRLGALIGYDTVSVPLVYTQVIKMLIITIHVQGDEKINATGLWKFINYDFVKKLL